MTFKIQKKYLLSLGTWLNGLSLAGKQSRARTRFINLLQDALKRTEDDRKQIVEQYALKDKDEKPIMVEGENGTQNYDVPDEKKEEMSQELAELFDETAELSGPETAPVFMMVKDIVLNYEKDIDPAIAGAYDEWCNAFEVLPTNV